LPNFFSFFSQTGGDRLSESRAALERKAALYDRLSAGNMLEDEEAERYEVNFLLKEQGGAGSRVRRDQQRLNHTYNNSTAAGDMNIDTSQAAVYTTTGGLLSADMRREQQRRSWEESMQKERFDQNVADERREVIEQLERQTREERDRAAIARQERQHVENRKRERLKAEFLKKKLEAAKKGAAAKSKGDSG
jgi:hypothetical protein